MSSKEVSKEAGAERLQKILARAGISSRRMAEDLIREGAVTVNGKIAGIGDKATLGVDAIKVQGKLLQGAEEKVYLAFNKPKAVISMMIDPENRSTLSDYLAHVKARVFPIGRLDYMSDGLILLTNDGEIAEKLQRQDSVVRVYEVKVKGHLDAHMLDRLRRGAKVGNRFVKPHTVRVDGELTSKSLIEFSIVGSGVFDVKTYFEHKGCLVDRVTRVAIGQIKLGDLKPGEFRTLTLSQVEALLTQPELGLRALARDEEKEAVREERRLGRLAKREEAEAAEAGIETPATTEEHEESRPRRRGYGASASEGGLRREARAEEVAAVRAEREAAKAARAEGKSFGGDRPPRSFASNDRAPRSFGRDREDRPQRSFGGGFGGDRPKRSFGGGDRPFGKKPFGRSLGDKGPQRSFDRDERPKRSFDRDERGERPARGGFGGGFKNREGRPARSFGDRPQRTFGAGGDRPYGKKPFGRTFDRGERPQRSFDRDERPRSFGDDRPKRSFGGGERPFAKKPFGSRDRDERPKRSFGDERPKRSFGGGFGRTSGAGSDRPFGKKPFGDRPARGGFGGSRPRSSGMFVKRRPERD